MESGDSTLYFDDRLLDIQLMFDSHFSAFQKILEAAEVLGDETFVARPPVGDRSLRGLLVHTLNAQRGWRRGIVEHVREAGPNEETYPTVASLAARWVEEEQDMRAYLGSMTEPDLEEIFAFVPVWQVLVHLYTHGVQHRSEAAMLLAHHGQSIGAVDFYFYAAAKAPRPE